MYLFFFWQKTTWWKLNLGVEIISMNISYNNQSIITIFSEHSVCLWWFKLIILLNNLRVGPKDEKIIERNFLAWKECKNKALQVPAEIVIQISIHKTIYASTNSSRGIESNKYMRLKNNRRKSNQYTSSTASCKMDDNKCLISMMSISLQKSAQDKEKHKDNEFSPYSMSLIQS